MSHRVKENMDDHRNNLFEVSCIQAHKLEQPMANNGSGFYVMWVMHQYLGGSSKEGNKMVSKLPISCISVNSITHYSLG
jgi:hypothetical protein